MKHAKNRTWDFATRQRERLFLVLPALLCACGGGGGGNEDTLQITAQPPALSEVEIDELWSFQFALENEDPVAGFSILQGPTGLTVDSNGLMNWTPSSADMGSEPVQVQISDEDQDLLVDFTLRVHQGILLGTAYSPAGHVQTVTQQDGIDYLTSTTHGRLVGYHTNWRDAGASQGEIPTLVHNAFAALDQFGAEPTLVLGWADGNGIPDLTSDSEPMNNTWTNAETRAEFVAMLADVADTYQPQYLAISNELNIWYATHQAEFSDWLSVYQTAYDAIKLASPNTKVYATFQLEFLKGEGFGWPHGDTWTSFDQLVAGGPMDVAVFTSYPYLEYAMPALIPSDHYDEITAHWGAGPIAFTELGWLAAPSFPYPGSETDQSSFIDRFFELTTDLDIDLAQWLYLHDVDIQAMFPPFIGVGLRDNSGGVIRPADATWQAAVTLREKND